MRFALDMGHTPASPGARGHLDELTEDRRIGAALRRIIEAAGHEVADVTAPDSMTYPQETNYRVTMANRSGAELFVSVHLNAGGGTGTEVLYYGGDARGLELATRISAEVAACLGLRDRGAKARTNEVAVIRDTAITAVLVEVCFVDSADDAAAYRAAGAEAVAAAIARGLGIEVEETEEETMATAEEIRRAVWNTPIWGDGAIYGTEGRGSGGGYASPANLWAYTYINSIDIPRRVWGYRNEKLETADAYQILRDIRDGVREARAEIAGLREDVEELRELVEQLQEDSRR